MQGLAGKVAIVTGAAQGMGLSHARLLHEYGAKVVLADIQDEATARAANALDDTGETAFSAHLDISSATDWESLVAEVRGRWDRVDVLVNNAAVMGGLEAVADETDEGWDFVLSINARGTWYGMRSVIPAMREQGGGSIVNICSINGVVGAEGHVSYQTSKGAVRMLTKNAAVTYARSGIRVNNVCPGVIDTTMAVDAGDLSDDEFAEATPLGRLGRSEEVSAAVAFLASDLSAYITGVDLMVDGGFTAQGAAR